MLTLAMFSICLTFLTLACASAIDNSGTAVSQEELRRLRLQMVDRQIIARGVKDPLVLEALNTVERHQFVLPGQEREAYEDGPLPIGDGQNNFAALHCCFNDRARESE